MILQPIYASLSALTTLITILRVDIALLLVLADGLLIHRPIELAYKLALVVLFLTMEIPFIDAYRLLVAVLTFLETITLVSVVHVLELYLLVIPLSSSVYLTVPQLTTEILIQIDAF